MITRVEAEAIAARWARGEAEQRGYACAPALAEFDLGWVIWTSVPPEVLPVPGDGARTVVDRETGVISTWPAIPCAQIADLYRERRPRPSATVDPSVALRRAMRRRPSPTTAAEVTAAGRPFRAQGAKGDQRVDHHPEVGERLAALPASARVRGADRHAELIAVSDALHATGQVGAEFRAQLVREQKDPTAGAMCRPCATCLAVLVDLGVLPRSEPAHTTERGHGSDQIPAPARIPPEAGRRGVELPGTHRVEEASRAADLPAFPAARQALAEFGGVRCGRPGPGQRRAIRLLTFDPLPGALNGAALAEFAEVIATPVFPLAVEGDDALVVIDERSRVFVLDQAGEWFVGDTVDMAVTALLTGDGPADRVRDDGTW